MATVEIDAHTLARVYDLAKDRADDTREDLDDGVLSEDAGHMARAMLAKYEASLDIVAEELENDPDVKLDH